MGTFKKEKVPAQENAQVQKTRAPYRVTVRGLVGGREWIREPRTEKHSPGLFFPACGRSCCSHLTLSSHKPRTPYRETVRGLVGGREWIREPRTEKQSPGLFSPACGRSCCSHLTLSSHKPRTPYRETVRGLVGGREWIRTTEVVDGRFTVCSLWPLGNSPIFNFCVAV